jgi:hypothetical protein
VKSESIRPKSGSTNGPISIAADLNQLQIENKNGAEESKNGGRQLMECDSSVPSPPSKQQDEEMLPRPSSSMMMKEEEGEGEDCKGNFRVWKMMIQFIFIADPISRKRHSDSGDGNMDKPRPMKQPRKSNEVARLLNDLTAGNCMFLEGEEVGKNIMEGKEFGTIEEEIGKSKLGGEFEVVNQIEPAAEKFEEWRGENLIELGGKNLDETGGSEKISSTNGRTYGWWRKNSWKDSLEDVEDEVNAPSSSSCTPDSSDSSCSSNTEIVEGVNEKEMILAVGGRKTLSLEENWLDVFCYDDDEGQKSTEILEYQRKSIKNEKEKFS